MIVTRKRKGHPTGEAQRAEAGSGAEAKVGCSPKCRSASGAFGHLGLGPLICLPQPVLHARSVGQLPGLAAGRPQGVWSPRRLTCSEERGLEPVPPAPSLLSERAPTAVWGQALCRALATHDLGGEEA